MRRSHDIHTYPYQPEIAPSILSLLKQVLGEGQATRKSVDFWQWKHHENPFGPSYGLYAWHEKRKIIAGLRMLMRWRFTNPQGEDIQAVRAVDTATHPDCQRQGIFSTLTKQALHDLEKEGIHFVFNTPNDQTSLPGYLKLGWKIVDKWPLYIKILNPIRIILQLLISKNNHHISTDHTSYFSEKIIPWNEFVDRYKDEIPFVLSEWEKTRHNIGLRTIRSLDYLQWRYGRQPNIKYYVFVREHNNSLYGFVILRSNIRYGMKEILLNEIFFREYSIKSGRNMIRNLLKELKGDYIISHFSRGTVERDILLRTGFFKLPFRKMTFTARPFNKIDQGQLDANNWDLTLGELEIF